MFSNAVPNAGLDVLLYACARSSRKVSLSNFRAATARFITMFTYVKFEDGVKEIVDTKNIIDFKIKDILYDKKYQIKWTDGHFYYGITGRIQQKVILEGNKTE